MGDILVRFYDVWIEQAPDPDPERGRVVGRLALDGAERAEVVFADEHEALLVFDKEKVKAMIEALQKWVKSREAAS